MSLPSRGDQVSSTARTAALRLAHCREFGLPATEAPEIAGERLAQLAFRRALVTKRGKEHLVQDHRVARDKLLALETVEHETRRFCEIKLGELRRDRIEAIDRAAIIIFVMTDEQLLRHSLDPRRITG
jgi:hypothetical protein